MRIACVVPARLNSTRFPRKLLALARGQSVITRTLLQAQAAFDEVYLATDSPEIAAHAAPLGVTVIETSPTCRNGTERIAEAVAKTPALLACDIIVNLQGDHPLTQPATLRAIVERLRDHPEAVVATAVTPSSDPHSVKCTFDRFGNALYFSRKPISSYAHIGVYAYRTPFLLQSLPPTPFQLAEDLEQLKFLEWGYKIQVAVVDERPLGVDTPQDLETLNSLLA